jgi:hypothetical protein
MDMYSFIWLLTFLGLVQVVDPDGFRGIYSPTVSGLLMDFRCALGYSACTLMTFRWYALSTATGANAQLSKPLIYFRNFLVGGLLVTGVVGPVMEYNGKGPDLRTGLMSVKVCE